MNSGSSSRCPLPGCRQSAHGQLSRSQMAGCVVVANAEAIDAFGAGRTMFASNFPVDRLYSSYAALWDAYSHIVADMAPHERDALFRTNAERIYRI